MSIIHKHIDEIFEYDGSQINPSWAFQEFGVYGSSIITWIGPVNITPDNLKDFADVGLEIKSNYMVNFMCEFFDQQPPNMRIAYLRQRLIVMIFREILTEYGIKTKREGDDIFVDDGKLSISIASISLSSAKIHFALNLEDKGTPDDVETIGLFDIKDENGTQIFNKDNLSDLINETASRFIDELQTIENDISKTKVLG
ncbi:hypothetical protein SAMN05216439_0757 [Methanobrevibacter gottschalkii]|uniref:DUF366 domain-containing protein n=1 Tax=Methanobrevibacter gottschalkii TaxID=190974 RepID=A0A1H7FSN1_9EURY|nr:DUF366 family protein [Methanobrevibacter gottschalkii]SEK29116.1 hypothetical protein SAMN05216439_0757 [Methanobrevibacter gottschalkii]